MTRYPTESTLLTWALTSLSDGPLLRVSPSIAQTVRLGRPSFVVRAYERLKNSFFAPKKDFEAPESRLEEGEGATSKSSCAREPGNGCKICKGAHFEIGAAAAGQEYL